MPTVKTINLEPEVWVEATEADAVTFTVQVQGTAPVRLMTSIDSTEPADINSGILLKTGFGFDRAVIANLIPGVAAAVRVFLRAENQKSRVFVSHD